MLKKNQWGGLIQTRVNYHFLECAYAGFFVDYVIQKFTFHLTLETAVGDDKALHPLELLNLA